MAPQRRNCRHTEHNNARIRSISDRKESSARKSALANLNDSGHGSNHQLTPQPPRRHHESCGCSTPSAPQPVAPDPAGSPPQATPKSRDHRRWRALPSARRHWLDDGRAAHHMEPLSVITPTRTCELPVELTHRLAVDSGSRRFPIQLVFLACTRTLTSETVQIPSSSTGM